jgi:hypothetical protein
MTTWHEQTRIEHDGYWADVDVGIAPLILALWRHHIPTQASCQGHPDGHPTGDNSDASISFPTGAAADAFVQLVKPHRLSPQSHGGGALLDPHLQWKWRASGDGLDSVYIHVFIPPADLPVVLDAIEHPDTSTTSEWLDTQWAADQQRAGVLYDRGGDLY